jgi:hypothetical protein
MLMGTLFKGEQFMSYDNLSNRQKIYIDAVIEHAPALGIDLNKTNFSRAELRQVSMTHKGKKWIPNWITHDVSRRVERGVFSIPEILDAVAVSPGTETEGDIEADTAFIEDNPQSDVDVQVNEELINVNA